MTSASTYSNKAIPHYRIISTLLYPTTRFLHVPQPC